MSDAKEDYSRMVKQLRQQAETDPKLAKQIADAFERKKQYRDNWGKVDINEFTQLFVPGYTEEIRNNKICYINPERTLAVVADVGGVYCRLQDWALYEKSGKLRYFDINGNFPSNYKDERGKMHGMPKSERQKITHFTIKQRNEMNNK